MDAVPFCLNTKRPKDFIQAVKWLEPSFGGINLEDLAKLGCFTILEELKQDLDIPVWHDDQQGTAVVIALSIPDPDTIKKEWISE